MQIQTMTVSEITDFIADKKPTVFGRNQEVSIDSALAYLKTFNEIDKFEVEIAEKAGSFLNFNRKL